MKPLVLALVAVLSLTLTAQAQDKCGATKMKAAGKKLAAKANCYAKALAHAEPVSTDCLLKAEQKFGVTCSTSTARIWTPRTHV